MIDCGKDNFPLFWRLTQYVMHGFAVPLLKLSLLTDIMFLGISFSVSSWHIFFSTTIIAILVFIIILNAYTYYFVRCGILKCINKSFFFFSRHGLRIWDIKGVRALELLQELKNQRVAKVNLMWLISSSKWLTHDNGKKQTKSLVASNASWYNYDHFEQKQQDGWV